MKLIVTIARVAPNTPNVAIMYLSQVGPWYLLAKSHIPTQYPHDLHGYYPMKIHT